MKATSAAVAFNPNRFVAFLRFDFLSRRGDYLLPLLVAGGLALAKGALTLSSGGTVSEFPSTLFTLGILIGIGTALGAHRPDNEPATAAFSLMLPTSHAERFATRWLLSFGLTLLGNYVLLQCVTLLFAALGWALGRGAPGADLWPSGADALGTLGTLVTAHSIFFAGGAFFRKGASFKTLLCVVAYAILFSLFATLFLVSGVYTSIADAVRSGAMGQTHSGSFVASEQMGSLVLWLKVAYCVVLPALLYAATYFRVTEAEVRA